MTSLESLLSEVEGGLIDRLVLDTGETLDGILSNLDADEFAERWMAIFRDVEARKSAVARAPAAVDLTVRIREATYLKAFARWRSSDLAAYISDDFGLIADAIAGGVDDPRIAGILRSYRCGRIPCALS